MTHCIFTNDNNVKIELLYHPFTEQFMRRDNHEVMFRRIHTFLITNHILSGNFIDLGAWIGDNSLPWAKNIPGKVYAIDPSPENCDFIKQMAKINKVENISVIQTAISDRNEVLSTDTNLQHCSFIHNYLEENSPTKKKELINDGARKVNACSLDFLLQVGVLETIDYIHLDVEGMEFKVLQGAVTILDSHRPILTFEQHLHADNYIEIVEYLYGKQYKVFLINEELPGCRIDCRNFIAFPLEKYSNELMNRIHTYLGTPILVPVA
jgi:FkbM family methyltransferase